MADHMTVQLVLTGPYAGKTMNLNGVQYDQGVATLQGPAQSLAYAITYHGRSYQAFPAGSDELKAAQLRDAMQKEGADGKHDVSPTPEQRPSTAVHSDLQPDGQGPTGSETADGSGDAGAEAGDTGTGSARDGHADAGHDTAEVERGQSQAKAVDAKLSRIVKSLDPDVAAHWTGQGKPSMKAVEEAYGSTGITRSDVEAAAPGWTREKAQTEALKNL